MNYQIRKVKVSDIRNYVELKHYSHNINGLKITVCYGLFEANTLKGAIIFGQLTTTAWKKYGSSEGDVIELRRMVVDDDCPRNTNTWFMSRALRDLRRNFNFKVCVSYADPEHGPVGIVYQAANWVYVGTTASDTVLETPEGKRYHSRALRTKYKGELKPFAKRLCQLRDAGLLKEIKVSGKHTYLYPLKGEISLTKEAYPK
ncbi:hypothetical protein EOK02_19350 [Salmonella enterica]|nr:hypothetical protein [Salmonella enterica]EBH8405772.1 hypothetical protein [Salmonella enterica subsp. enterica serovar Cerro]EBH9533082.1 hypothetical protein [Salmonella enterica subsp. enterica serovar Cerro]